MSFMEICLNRDGKKRKAAEKQRQTEETGSVTGGTREEAVQRLQEKHGSPTSAATVKALPGWRVEVPVLAELWADTCEILRRSWDGALSSL